MCSRFTARDAARPYEIEVGRLMSAVSDRHIEIMRDDLAEIFYDAGRDGVEYLFGDSITAITEDAGGVNVTFEQGQSRRFDLVIGADGLHSNVRGLVFGPESSFATWIGAYLAVATVPELPRPARSNGGDLRRRPDGRGLQRRAHGRRAGDLHVSSQAPTRLPLSGHGAAKGSAAQRIRRDGQRVSRLLDEADRAEVFYLDSITQLRMDSWSRGRVSLVGDAGYCPGPAVGGSTSLAVVGAYVLAGELAIAGGDHTRAFPSYERAISDYVRRSRAFAMGAAKRLRAGQRDRCLGVHLHGAARHPSAGSGDTRPDQDHASQCPTA